MKCGFFELDITPYLNSIIPGSFGARLCNDVQDPLFVRSFVGIGESSSCAIAVIDAVGITWDITERIRRDVASRAPLKESEIMVLATHCHGGGPTINWGEEVVRDEEYITFLVRRSADSIVLAYKKAVECELKSSTSELYDISFIRDFIMKDGTLKTNPGRANADKIDRPCTEIDPELLVLWAFDGDKPAGAIINFALHPAIVHNYSISGDYISVLSRELKKKFGHEFVTVFINGACGDINHVNPLSPEPFPPHREIYVAQRLAEECVKSMDNLTPVGDSIVCAESSFDARLRKPTAEELTEAKELFDSLGDKLIEKTPSSANYQPVFFALQRFLIMADKRTLRPIHLQIIKIGNIKIFGNPCQIYVNFGKKIKEACGKGSMPSAFALDYCGYVPTPECMKPGIYEATLAPTSGLEADTGDRMCEEMIKLYNTIK